MMLGELIEWLMQQPPKATVRYGFGAPDSYRGYYDQCAFEPVENALIGDMLQHARNAVYATFHGYKGGEYTFDEWTDCWVASYGTTRDSTAIDHIVLQYWLADINNS